ncbi:carbohydrate binding domain-containing protein [Bacillus thuringiensis]|uniref:carbohydrate binding domain-containing protein n=1 Tax=Bacillus thuringiensis TaxID=1428 RepID=UPI000E49FADA|nr:carbohydrate binding domain-containing protein [Bacillus thuringiensis]MDZ3952440.1 carbohydrate binding domain-containing protein [Bacillus thuringiensis]RGP45257.1 hypothetical protein BTW32_26245 [Bacillus thuringiensis]
MNVKDIRELVREELCNLLQQSCASNGNNGINDFNPIFVGFENGTTFPFMPIGSGYGIVVEDATVSYEGTHVLKIPAVYNGKQNLLIESVDIEMKKGKTYKIELYAKGDGGIKLRFRQNGTILKELANGLINNYVKYELDYLAMADSNVKVEFEIDNRGARNIAYIDNVLVQQVGVLQSLVENGDFEQELENGWTVSVRDSHPAMYTAKRVSQSDGNHYLSMWVAGGNYLNVQQTWRNKLEPNTKYEISYKYKVPNYNMNSFHIRLRNGGNRFLFSRQLGKTNDIWNDYIGEFTTPSDVTEYSYLEITGQHDAAVDIDNIVVRKVQ